MSNKAVVYKSKYGSTKRYAQWIAEEAKADCFECSEIEAKKLLQYDTIIYGGGLYASGIDYKKLGIVHKSMMAMLKSVVSKKSSDELTDDDRELLATYGRKVDFTDKNMIKPLISFLES